MKILFITLSNLGDCILTLPALAALEAKFPNAEVSVLAGEKGREVFEGDPRVKEAMLYQKSWAQVKRLRKQHYDLVVDLRNTWLPLFIGAKRRSPLRSAPREILHMRDRHLWKVRGICGFSMAVQQSSLRGTPKRSEGDRSNPLTGRLRTLKNVIARLAACLACGSARRAKPLASLPEFTLSNSEGVARNDRGSCWTASGGAQDVFYISPEDDGYVEGLLSGARDFIVIAPGAKSHTKRWPAEKFVELINNLAGPVVLVGDESDTKIVEKIIAGCKARPINLCAKTTIRQLAAALKRARSLITNDSAPLHIASSLGVPTVAIFGPTDPKKYGPTGVRDIVVRKDWPCAPCEEALCRFDPVAPKCMNAISPEEVLSAVERLRNRKVS